MFKYIYDDDNGIPVFEEYFEYLQSIKEVIGDELFNFAIDINRYNLTSKHSLHDSWLKSVQINDSIGSSRGTGFTETDILIQLLGPHHDRLFHLIYKDVKKYNLNKPEKNIPANNYDLLCHEVRLNEKQEKEHLVQFDNEIIFQVTFSEFKFEEHIITNLGSE